ncbi:hypothetical protein [Streptomyces sp. NPDC046860]|uniref:hypothetical protein n=1 Tax=Streptomyces sp. NPDC046860 TaxID=3154495 RepID=UPI0033EDDB86
MRDDRDDQDDRHGRNNRHERHGREGSDDRDASRPRRPPPPRAEIHWLPPHRRDDECPWCRLLIAPPGPPPAPGPARWPARLRTLMVAFSALVTLVAAAVTLWRA